MKKRLYVLTLAAVLLLTGTAGCSSGNIGSDSDEDSIVKTLMQTVLNRGGDKKGDLAEEGSEKENLEDENGEGNSEDEEMGSENLTENGDEAEESGILNNGGTVVRFQGKDYYWKYTADSVEDEGLFTHFYNKTDVPNQMVCCQDGTEEVLFTMAGNGKIYLVGDRMYLATEGEGYSVKMDGTDRIDYGYCRWEAVDEEGEGIIGYGGQKFFRVDSKTGEIKELADSSGDMYGYYFAGGIDGYLYFSSYDPKNQVLVLYQYKLDDSAGIQEADRTALIGELYNAPGNVIVTQIERLDNTLYYSYGFYAGTGGFFQTGGINYIVQDENRNTVESGVLVPEITAEEFLVEKGRDSVNVYYIDGENGSYIGYWENNPYAGCSVMNSAAGTVQPSDFRLSRPGAAVYLDGAICRAEKNQASHTVLIPEPLATSYGCKNEDLDTASEATIIRNVEVIGNDVYYTVEKSSRNAQNDFGWRPSFLRMSSERYKMTIGSGEPKLLFAY